jgi:hypothetical protein
LFINFLTLGFLIRKAKKDIMKAQKNSTKNTKNSIVYYYDWNELISPLSDEEKLEFFDIVFLKKPFDLSKIKSKHLLSVLKYVLKRIDKNNEKYEEIKEKRRLAGIESGRVRRTKGTHVQNVQQNEQEETKKDFVQQNELPVPVTVTDNVFLKGKTFSPPTLSQVETYAKKKKYSIDPKQFLFVNKSKNWEMLEGDDWKSLVDNWAKLPQYQITEDPEKTAKREKQELDNCLFAKSEIGKDLMFKITSLHGIQKFKTWFLNAEVKTTEKEVRIYVKSDYAKEQIDTIFKYKLNLFCVKKWGKNIRILTKSGLKNSPQF